MPGGEACQEKHRLEALAMAKLPVQAVLCSPVHMQQLASRRRQPSAGGVKALDLSFRFGAEGDGGFQVLWEDCERVFCRGWRLAADGQRNAVLALLPAVEHPPPSSLSRL